ncbi:MAG: hypothetical protein QXM52_00110 [Candidatus Bathyarchaeia archaeon]
MSFFSGKIVVGILVVILALSCNYVTKAYSPESVASEKALTFLKDIVMLDLRSYNVKLAKYNNYFDHISRYVVEEISYNLTCSRNTIEAVFEFMNGTLIFCKLYRTADSKIYFQTSPTNILDAIKGLMRRYQAYSGAAYLQKMRDMLDTVTELKPMASTSGNVKLRIRNNGPYTYIEWIYTANGIDVERKRVIFAFYNGFFERFADTWDLYKVGTTDLKVSRDEAIRIAREYAYTHPYTFGGVPVNFTILDEPVSAELSMEPREGYTLYPWWNIRLYLDKVYPGNVGSIQVTLWADTGEVTHCEAISIGGTPIPTPPSEPPTESAPDSSSSQNNPNPLFILAAIIVVAIAFIAIKKKRK